MKQDKLTFPDMAAVPSAAQIAALALQSRRLTIEFASRLTSHSLFGQDPATRFLHTLKEELTGLLPGNRAILLGSHLRGSGPQERSADGTLASWSYLVIYRTLTEQQALWRADRIVAAAREYDFLATDLMTRLISQLGDEPAFFAHDPTYWGAYQQTGRLDDWQYVFHGIHCGFWKGGWSVQASQGCENEMGYGFGVLEPGFFADFCAHRIEHARLAAKVTGQREHLLRIFDVLAQHSYLRCVKIYNGTDVGYIVPPLSTISPLRWSHPVKCLIGIS